MRACFPTISTSPGTTMPVCGGVEVYNERSFRVKYCSQEVQSLYTPGFYSNIFLVRKASEEWCPVIDLKQLNFHINAPHFHTHTISSVLNAVERGDYMFKIDLQDEYFHVLIHPNSRKYFRFAFENKVYQFRVLPFCLNTAPQW